MSDKQKLATLCAVVISAFGVIGWSGGASAASAGGPNYAYCLSDSETGSPWCGYTTWAQCQASASGTGGDCTENVYGKSEHSVQNAYAYHRVHHVHSDAHSDSYGRMDNPSAGGSSSFHRMDDPEAEGRSGGG